MPVCDIRQRLPWLAFLVMMNVAPTRSQQMPGIFGRITEMAIVGNPVGVFLGDFNGDTRIDCGVFSSSHITFLYGTKADSFSSSDIVRAGDRIQKAVSADCNRDGLSDVVLLTEHPRVLSVLVARRQGFREVWADEVPYDVDRCIVRDMNGDRRPDITLYGRKNLGLLVLSGKGNGDFGTPTPLLEDYSFSKIVLHDLNGDRVVDVIGYDWVNNRLLMFSGLGGLRFSSPFSFSLPADFIDFTLVNVNGDDNIDLVVLSGEPRVVKIYQGDGLGNFGAIATLDVSIAASEVSAVDIDENGKQDLVLFSEKDKGFAIRLNFSEGEYSQDITYSAGIAPADFESFVPQRARPRHLVVLDKGAHSVLVYHPMREQEPPARNAVTYALGLRPQKMKVFDVNHDSLPDILVTNSGSAHLSVFLNMGHGSFRGQIPIRTEPGSETVEPLWKNDSTLLCITTNPSAEKILVTEVSFPGFRATSASVPTGGNPGIISAWYDSVTSSLVLLVGNKDRVTTKFTVSEIRQLADGQVIERPYLSSQGSTLLAADVSDPRNGVRQLFYVLSSARQKRAAVYIVPRYQTNTMGEPLLVFTLPDTGVRDANVWGVNLNSDSLCDLVLHYRSKEEVIGFSVAKTETSFSPLQTFSQVGVKYRYDVNPVDIDGDGLVDIVVVNALTKTLQVFLNRGQLGFSMPNRLLSLSAGGGAVAADFNRDGTIDYAAAYGAQGVLRIYFGK